MAAATTSSLKPWAWACARVSTPVRAARNWRKSCNWSMPAACAREAATRHGDVVRLWTAANRSRACGQTRPTADAAIDAPR